MRSPIRFPLYLARSLAYIIFALVWSGFGYGQGASIQPVQEITNDYYLMELSFPTEAGRFYRIERTEDFESWETEGPAFLGDGETVVRHESLKDAGRFFYRSRIVKDEWAMVWSDEFEGEEIDRAKWLNDVNADGGGNNELQYYTDEADNAFVSEGRLVIRAKRENYAGSGGSRAYTSAKLTSKFRGSWKYGRFEIRAKLPIGQGIWPAISMRPMSNEQGSWASSGEIDIVDLVGSEPSTIHGTLHYGGAWTNSTRSGDSYELGAGTFNDAFHVFALEWEEGEIRWYVDGELYQTQTDWYSTDGVYPAPFDKAFYLILNVAVGGNWPGDPDATTPFPAEMEIDYVRVYQWADDATAQIKVVESDAPVLSPKRGVGLNQMGTQDWSALAPGVAWYYNWGTTELSKPAGISSMEFVPMVWNGHSSFQTDLQAMLSAGKRPPVVLFANEPNLLSQAGMMPEATAQLYQQIKAIAEPYGIPVIGPQMAIGSPSEDSITAFSPTQNKTVSYTYQEPFLLDFFDFAGASQPTSIGTHAYGNFGEVSWVINELHKPWPTKGVWLTEFTQWDAPSEAAAIEHMIKSVDYLERTSWVEGYAWFKERGVGVNDLLAQQPGQLTALGEAYVNMPIHDPNLFYRIRPGGRLEAERYVADASMAGSQLAGLADISRTTDVDGLADMIATQAGTSLDYNIHVDASGSYNLGIRAAGATGSISIYTDTTLLGSVNVTSSTAWATLSTPIQLPAGSQTLRVVLETAGQRINWLRF